MNQYLTGNLMKELREKRRLTQAELAKKLNVSDKTVSKWETGKGYPGITLLQPIASVFGISLTELLSGNLVENLNLSSNVMRSHFYVCPICNNVVYSMGELSLSCHGIALTPQIAEACDGEHSLSLERVEDDYYIQIPHEMTKTHYISFVAAISLDRVQIVKLYPEGAAECRFPARGVECILFYCNRDGLFYWDVRKKTKEYEPKTPIRKNFSKKA